MARQNDTQYARVLMDHLQRDCERFGQSGEWAPIVLWMVEEVRRQSGALRVPRDVSRQMTLAARQAQALVLRASA